MILTIVLLLIFFVCIVVFNKMKDEYLTDWQWAVSIIMGILSIVCAIANIAIYSDALGNYSYLRAAPNTYKEYNATIEDAKALLRQYTIMLETQSKGVPLMDTQGLYLDLENLKQSTQVTELIKDRRDLVSSYELKRQYLTVMYNSMWRIFMPKRQAVLDVELPAR